MVTFARAKDFPAAKALCNSNLEFDHESQTFEDSEPELDALNETVLGSTNIQCCASTHECSHCYFLYKNADLNLLFL